MPGPHSSTPLLPGDTGSRPRLPAPGSGSRERESPSPQTPLTAGRGTPHGQSPAISAARNTQQGMQDKGPMPGSHACTPAPTACVLRTPNAFPKGGQPEGHNRFS